MSERDKFPYQPLGSRLKRMREKLKETLAEVSGAVEIEIDDLAKFEQGSDRPSEDILLLLISHFGVREDEATKLWKLAAYDQPPFIQIDADDNDQAKAPVAVSPSDVRIAYTDMVHVTVNDYGVVLNFMQNNGPSGQPMIVSRVGMSKEHARSVLEILQKTLTLSEPKALPAPDTSRDNRGKN